MLFILLKGLIIGFAILSFIAIFAGLGMVSAKTDILLATCLVLGIFIGSLAWWLLLSSSVAFILRHKLSQRALKIINSFSGIVILVFGVLALVYV